MIRVLVFLTAVLAAGSAAVWIADQSGRVSLVMGGYHYQTTLGFALMVIVLAATLLAIIWSIFRAITRGPDALTGFMRSRRRNKGLEAIARGLVAVGTGDERAARHAMKDARRFLPASPLTRIVAAQAAQLAGDHSAAENAFRAMLEDEETRALGLRGLFVEARRQGDNEKARGFAEEALRTTPDAPWAGPALLDYQCATSDWSGALTTVERNTANRITDRATARRQRAVLITAEAMKRAEEDAPAALTLALEAVKLAPDLIPAATLAGRLLAETGDAKKAMKIAETAWKTTPHPDLAEIYIRARHGDTAQDRLKKAKNLASKDVGSPEGRLALARAALEARDVTLARETLRPLIENGPTVRTALLMAEIEDTDQGDRAAARGWLARAMSARRDPSWMADGIAVSEWQPVSPFSGQLDGVHWGEAREALPQPSPVVENIIRDADAASPETVNLPAVIEPAKPVAMAAGGAAPVTPPSAPEKAALPENTITSAPIPDDPGAGSDPYDDDNAPASPRPPVFGPP